MIICSLFPIQSLLCWLLYRPFLRSHVEQERVVNHVSQFALNYFELNSTGTVHCLRTVFSKFSDASFWDPWLFYAELMLFLIG